MVGPRQDGAGVFEHVANVADVDRNDLHRLRHRNDWEVGLFGHAIGSAVSGAGLFRGDVGVGHQVGGSANDAAAVALQDDCAVHFGQLAKSGGGERDIEVEPARCHRFDHFVVAHHDQRTSAPTQDALKPVSQGGAGRNRGDVDVATVIFH